MAIQLKKKATIGAATFGVAALTAGFTLGISGRLQTQAANAMVDDHHDGVMHDQNALIIDAAELYAAQQGAVADHQQYYGLQVVGNNARGKVYTGDSGSVFYATKLKEGSSSRWQVVFAGQTTVPPQIAQQYGMPQSWTTDINF